ncbi:MAG: hypothetical protein NC935_06980 [Candidatus Omnitrophica bacterium]|nr:hypothetical protein [Candidatus Omnitrophota bacterium]
MREIMQKVKFKIKNLQSLKLKVLISMFFVFIYFCFAQEQNNIELTTQQPQNITEEVKSPQEPIEKATKLEEKEGIIPSLKFKDADIKVVLSAIAEKATKEGKKINIVFTPKVTGLVTINLEEVDWQTALEALLKTYGYAAMYYKDIVIIGTFEEIKEKEVQERERQGVEPPQIKVFKLKYIDANDAKRAVDPILSPAGKSSVLEITGQAGWEFGTDVTKRTRQKEGRISRTKVLLVSDISRKLSEVENLLKEIDVMPKQILINAKIMEVNRDALKDIGFDWGTGSSGASSATEFSQVTFESKDDAETKSIGGHILSGIVSPSVFSPKTEGLSIANTGLKLVFKQLTGTEFEAIIHALEEDVRTNILSAPTIITLNNQEASILVGTKYPIIKTSLSTETGQIVGGSLDIYQDIGIQLNVVPQICGESDEFINMIIHPAVTSYTQTSKVVSGTTTLVEYPIILSREAETQILIKDGETIVLGGLLKDVKSTQQTGVPFLSKLPIIGWFFRRDTKDTEKVDLLIFITAHIVKPGEIIPETVLKTSDVTSKFKN